MTYRKSNTILTLPEATHGQDRNSGLLPLYLKLYDDMDDGTRRVKIDEFPRTIAAELEKRGLEVVTAPVSRIQKEFAAAVKKLEAEKVDALVTLHLAYSPSLEASDVLAGTKLPIIVLDTTPTYSFSPSQDPDELMYNHGIHGVQDMCNLLIRNGKPFLIEAGHWQKSDVLDRVAALVTPARMAAALRRGKVGMIGTAFKGMGDFFVPAAKIKSTLGATVKSMDAETMKKLVAAVAKKDVDAEVAEDLQRFAPDGASPEAHARSVKLGLAIRKWIEKEGLTAVTFNFLDMEKKNGYPTAPFLEMSKAMARGIGYAGEGDTLTALLVGRAGGRHSRHELHRDVLSRLGEQHALPQPHGGGELASPGRHAAASGDGLSVQRHRQPGARGRQAAPRGGRSHEPRTAAGRRLPPDHRPRHHAAGDRRGPSRGIGAWLVHTPPAGGGVPGGVQPAAGGPITSPSATPGTPDRSRRSEG